MDISPETFRYLTVVVVAIVFILLFALIGHKLGQGRLGRWIMGRPAAPDPGRRSRRRGGLFRRRLRGGAADPDDGAGEGEPPPFA